MKIQESAENYLETILMLGKEKPYVRSIDIANELNFSKPSVSVAMKNLRQKNYVNVSEEGYLSLTGEGLKLAATVYERHSVISNWLISLGVSQDVAVEDACRMEHVISPASFQKLTELYQRNYPNTESTCAGRRFNVETDPADR
mgnify:CR=1 FL=1